MMEGETEHEGIRQYDITGNREKEGRREKDIGKTTQMERKGKKKVRDDINYSNDNPWQSMIIHDNRGRMFGYGRKHHLAYVTMCTCVLSLQV